MKEVEVEKLVKIERKALTSINFGTMAVHFLHRSRKSTAKVMSVMQIFSCTFKYLEIYRSLE